MKENTDVAALLIRAKSLCTTSERLQTEEANGEQYVHRREHHEAMKRMCVRDVSGCGKKPRHIIEQKMGKPQDAIYVWRDAIYEVKNSQMVLSLM